MTSGTATWPDYSALSGSVEASTTGPAGEIALVDLLDRVLGTGVVIAGDIVISLSGVDLVQVRLHALISTIRADMTEPTPREAP